MTDTTIAALLRAADEAHKAGDRATEVAARAALAAVGVDPYRGTRGYGL